MQEYMCNINMDYSQFANCSKNFNYKGLDPRNNQIKTPFMITERLVRFQLFYYCVLFKSENLFYNFRHLWMRDMLKISGIF